MVTIIEIYSVNPARRSMGTRAEQRADRAAVRLAVGVKAI
jgi:hypothetical protein